MDEEGGRGDRNTSLASTVGIHLLGIDLKWQAHLSTHIHRANFVVRIPLLITIIFSMGIFFFIYLYIST